MDELEYYQTLQRIVRELKNLDLLFVKLASKIIEQEVEQE